jgi:hypothetical protein
MSTNTPDRLTAFRAEYEAAERPRSRGLMPILILSLSILTGINCLVLLFVVVPRLGSANESAPSAQSSDLRALATYLEEKNLPGEALGVYSQYLSETELAPDERARVCVNGADAAVKAEKYETALAFLYQAELAAPASPLKPEIDKKVALCLEKLGRSSQLRHELRNRTALQRTKQDIAPNEIVLAEIGDHVITSQDLDADIDRMPESVRGMFEKPEKREELLRNLVAEKLLVEKARRLELDKDDGIQKSLASALDELMVRKLIENDVKANVKITPEDVERFYKAEIKRFTTPAAANAVFVKGATADEAKAATNFSEKPVPAVAGRGVMGLDASESAADTILAAEAGTTTDPIQIGGAWYVFKVVDKKPEEVAPFEKVKDACTRLFEQQKSQEQASALVAQTLQSSNVKLYPERLRGEAK